MGFRFKNKKIAIISPEPWEHVFVSKHHYSIQLARLGNEVFYINPPSGFESISKTDFKDVYSINYTGFPKGLRYYPKFIRQYFQRRVLHRIQNLASVNFDIIWSFDNSIFFDLDSFEDKELKISHIVDYSMDFQFKQAAKTADLNLSSSHYIVEKQQQVNPKSYFMNHGIPSEIVRDAFALEPSSKLKAGYAGNLNIPYIDWGLIRDVMQKQIDIDFYFAGSIKEPLPVQDLSNFKYVGQLEKPKLFWFLSQMDILILAYKADHHREQLANPHKLLEYLSTGKPIVATYTSEYVGSDLLYMSNKNSEWCEKFEEVVQLAGKESDGLIHRRKEWAKKNTYLRHINMIESLVNG